MMTKAQVRYPATQFGEIPIKCRIGYFCHLYPALCQYVIVSVGSIWGVCSWLFGESVVCCLDLK